MKKVLKVRVNGQKVVFENLPEAMEFLDELELSGYEAQMTEEEMSEQDYGDLNEFEGL